MPPELPMSLLLNIVSSLLLSLILGWLQVIFHSLHSLKKPVDLYGNYEKWKFFGQKAKHDWKPIHSKRVDHHVRVACVQKNSNLLRYFNKRIAINISYWASPLVSSALEMDRINFLAKNITIVVFPEISISLTRGHKTHWLIKSKLNIVTSTNLACVQNSFQKVLFVNQNLETDNSKLIQNIWCLIQKADFSPQKSSCAKKKSPGVEDVDMELPPSYRPAKNYFRKKYIKHNFQ